MKNDVASEIDTLLGVAPPEPAVGRGRRGRQKPPSVDAEIDGMLESALTTDRAPEPPPPPSWSERAMTAVRDVSRPFRAAAQAGGEAIVRGAQEMSPFGRGTEGPVEAIGRTARGVMEATGGALGGAGRGFMQSLASGGGELMTRRPTIGERQWPSPAEQLGAVGEAAGFVAPEAIPRVPRALTREPLSFEQWQQRYPGTERALRPELRPEVNVSRMTGQEVTGGAAAEQAMRLPRALGPGPRRFAPGDTPGQGFDLLGRARQTRSQLPPGDVAEPRALPLPRDTPPGVIDADFTVTAGAPTPELAGGGARALPRAFEPTAVTGRVTEPRALPPGELGLGAEGEGGRMVPRAPATPPPAESTAGPLFEPTRPQPVEFRPGETTVPSEPPPPEPSLPKPSPREPMVSEVRPGTPPRIEPPRTPVSPALERADTAFRGVSQRYTRAQEDYRAKRIGDDEFLRVRGEFDAAKRAWDDAEAAERSRPSPPKFERTAIGDQAVIGDVPRRAIPTTRTRATTPQGDIQDTALFGQERAARAEQLERAQGDIFSEPPASARPDVTEMSVDTKDPASVVAMVRAAGGIAASDFENIPLFLRNKRGIALDELAANIAKAQGRRAQDVEAELAHTMQRYRLEKDAVGRRQPLDVQEREAWARYEEEVAKPADAPSAKAVGEPPREITRPPEVSETEWNAMDPGQQRALWSVFNTFGRIPPGLLARLGLSVGGAAAGAAQGDTPSERAANAAMGATAGFLAPTALSGLRAAMEGFGQRGAIGSRPPEVPREFRRASVRELSTEQSTNAPPSTTPPAATSVSAAAGVPPVGAVARAWEYLTLPLISVWERMGPSGKKLSQTVQNQKSAEMRWIGQHAEPLLRATKRLTAAEKENLRVVMEEGGAPMNGKVAQAKAMADRVFGEDGVITKGARDRAIAVLGPDEKLRPFEPLKDFFPHEFSPEVREELIHRGSKRRERAIDHLLNTGQAHDRETAEVLLDSRFGSRRTTIGERTYILDPDRFVGGLERTRDVNLPDYIKDPVAAFTLRLTKVARRFTQLDHYGELDRNIGSPGGYEDPMTGMKVPAHGLIGEIQRTHGYERAQQAHAMFVESLGHRPDVSKAMRDAARKITGFEALTKLPLAVIANASQFGLVAARTGIGPMAKGLAASVTRAGRQAAQELGVVSDMSLRELYRDVGEPEGLSGAVGKTSDTVLKPFNAVEKWDRTVGANAGRAWADVVEKRLGSARNSEWTGRELDRLNFSKEEIADIRSRGRLTKEDRDRIAWAITDQTQFLGRAYRRSQFFNTPAGEVIGQFKSFAINAGRMMKQAVFDEAKRGNLKPLATVAVLFPVIGEGVQDVKALVRGSERPDSLAGRLIDNVFAVGGFGLATDFVQSLQYGEHGVANFLGGPAVSDAMQVLTRGYRAGQAAFSGDLEKTEKRLKSLLEYGVRQVPFVGPMASQQLREGPAADRRRQSTPMGRLGFDPDERALRDAERQNREHATMQKRVNDRADQNDLDGAWAIADRWNAEHPNAPIHPSSRRRPSEPGSVERRTGRLRAPYRRELQERSP